MKENLKKTLECGIKQIDPSLLSITSSLEMYFDEIMLFNPAFKLIGDSEEEIVTRHILDCLAPVNIIRKLANDGKADFADLGSGAGLPGIVLALAVENGRFTLVDRMERRIGFLRNTVARLGLSSRVNVVQKDLEKLDEKFDAVTFRAFRKMNDIAPYLDKITGKDGLVFAYKSSEDNIEEEIKAVNELTPGKFECSTVSYNVPLLEAKRSLLILKHL